MKFRLNLSDEKHDVIQQFLEDHGIETGDDGEYTISESSRYPSFLKARNEDRERVGISVEDVIFIEAFGKEIEIHTGRGTFLSQDRMYQLESILDPKEFIRVSKSVIVSRKHVKRIRPSFSMKYILTLTDGTLVDVTRSYCNDFRQFFNI